MTHEEAINEMRKIIFELGFEPDGTDVDSRAKALEMAIKALSDKRKDRKKAKRFKRKYIKLETALGKIKAELESLKRAEYQNFPTNALIYSRCIEIINKWSKELIDTVPTVEAVPIDVLREIRSEIENKRIEKPGGHWQLGIALDIIDKHLKGADE